MELYKDVPGFQGILKAVLKSQIQTLMEQLQSHTGEESVLLTASVTEGTLSHQGSKSGTDFLQDHDDIKNQFLRFCLKRHHNVDNGPESQLRGPGSFGDNQVIATNPARIGTFRRKSQSLFSGRHKQFDHYKNINSSLRKILPKSKNTKPAMKNTYTTFTKNSRKDQNKTAPFINDAETSPIFRNSETEIGNQSNDNGMVPSFCNEEGQEVRIKVEPVEDNDSYEIRVETDKAENNQMYENRLGEHGDQFDDSRGDNSSAVGRESSQMTWKPNDLSNLPTNITISKRKQSVPVKLTKSIGGSLIGMPQESPELGVNPSFADNSADNGIGSEGWYGNTSRSSIDINRIDIKDDRNEKWDPAVINSALKVGSKYSGRPIRGADSSMDYNTDDVSYGFSVAQDGNESQVYSSPNRDNSYQTYGDYDDGEVSGNKTKTPQIDGLLVSRGEGRYEKLIRCEICSKVCRTSNMARHKRRYCLGSPSMQKQQQRAQFTLNQKGNAGRELRPQTKRRRRGSSSPKFDTHLEDEYEQSYVMEASTSKGYCEEGNSPHPENQQQGGQLDTMDFSTEKIKIEPNDYNNTEMNDRTIDYVDGDTN